MASWPAAVAYTEPAPVARSRRVARRRDPLRSGVLWIVVVRTQLAGLVAVNVAVLQLNVRLDQLADHLAEFQGADAPPLSDYAVSREGIYEEHP